MFMEHTALQSTAHPSQLLNYQSYGVVGAGRSGVAAARLLLDMGRQVTLFDDFADPAQDVFQTLARQGARLCFGRENASINGLQALVTSPGVSFDHPLLHAARGAGLPVRAEIELGWLCTEDARVAAVTGTNGKTTVTMLIQKLCEDAGLRSRAVGNIGYPLCDAVREGREALHRTVFSTEISSFQLETTEAFSPDIAVILNITPDHLDRHPSMEAYAEAKGRITEKQGPGQVLVVNQDDPLCLAIALGSRARVRRFSLERPVEDGAWLDGDLIILQQPGKRPQRLMSICDLPMLGMHNVANAMAVACVGEMLGIDRAVIARTLTEFHAAPHRMELVASHGGVDYVDDSKATNLDAMRRALECFDGEVHLIAGGRDKNSPFETMTELLAKKVRSVYLIGEAATPMGQAWSGRIDCQQCGTMERALELASSRVEEGDTVLLSPGCASFDQFRSYAHRGEVFTNWVREHLAVGDQSR